MSLSTDALDAVLRAVAGRRFDGAASLPRLLWREDAPNVHDDRLSMRLEMPLRRLRGDRSWFRGLVDGLCELEVAPLNSLPLPRPIRLIASTPVANAADCCAIGNWRFEYAMGFSIALSGVAALSAKKWRKTCGAPSHLSLMRVGRDS